MVGEEEEAAPAKRKGKRVTDEEAKTMFAMSKGIGGEKMTLVAICQAMDRSEETVRKHIRRIEERMKGEQSAKADAYDNITNPQPPAASGEGGVPAEQAPSWDDEPPEPSVDLDELFEDTDDISPEEEHGLSKKLYRILLETKAVKDEDEAANIAKTYDLFPDYQNPHGSIEFLKGHDIKGNKATMISRLLFGWKQQQGAAAPGFNPGPVPPGGYGQPVPGQPWSPHYGPYPQHQQQWGGGPQQYPGYPGQPYPPPPYPPQPFQPQQKGPTKADVEKAIKDAVAENTAHWQKVHDAEQAEKKEGKLNATIGDLQAQIAELQANPPVAAQPGFETIIEPEFDNDGNLLRERHRVVKVEDAGLNQMRDEMNDLKQQMKDEREALSTDLKAAMASLSDAKTETVRTEMEGQVNLIKQKSEIFDTTQTRIDDINEKMWLKEKEVLQLEHAATGEQSEAMQVANMQKDLFTTGMQQMRLARQDLTRTLLVMSGKGKPPGAADVEQWNEEELNAFKQ